MAMMVTIIITLSALDERSATIACQNFGSGWSVDKILSKALVCTKSGTSWNDNCNDCTNMILKEDIERWHAVLQISILHQKNVRWCTGVKLWRKSDERVNFFSDVKIEQNLDNGRLF